MSGPRPGERSDERRRLLARLLAERGEGRVGPLSFAQRRQWVLDRLVPAGGEYNISIPLRVTGAIDTSALQRALLETVRRHESLRTVFPSRDGVPIQRVLPPAEVPLEEEDLRGVAGA